MKYLVIDTLKDLETACAYFAKQPAIGLDLETSALDPHDGEIVLCQLSDGEKTAILKVKQFLKNQGRYGLPKEDNYKVFDALRSLLENTNVKVIIHNSKFDIKWLIYHWNICPNIVFDTFLASQVIDYNDENDPKKAHNLGAVGRRFLGVDLDKTEQKSDWGREELTDEQMDYAALDVFYLPKLREAMYTALEADELLYTALIDFESVPCIAKTELHGINVNRKLYTEEITTLEQLRERAGKTLQEVLRPTTDINLVQPTFFGLPEKNHGDVLLTSSSQMLEALCKLGVPCVAKSNVEEVVRRESKGEIFAIGTGEKALAPLAGQYPVVKLLNDFRGVDKMTSAYGQGFLAHLRKTEDGYERVHGDFRINGAITGRMSCKNPPMQTIPDGEVEVGEDIYKLAFRKAFDFPKGRVGVIGDYSQIELRIATEFSKEPVFMEAFLTDRDLHALTASLVFKLPYENCSDKNHEYYHKYRAFAKRINFGIVYGIGAWGLAALLRKPVDECKEILELHKQEHPVLWQYLDRQKQRAKTSLRARTASGRLIRFRPPELDEFGKPDRMQLASIARVGTNMPIQGLGADILKIALKMVDDRLKGLDAFVVNIVHDEIMIECEESIADKVKVILETSMIEAGKVFLKNVPVVVDGHVISNWGEK